MEVNGVDGNMTLRTSNGSVHAEDVRGDLEAETSSTGTIHSDFEILTRGMLSKHRLEGKIAGGGPKYELTTSNGTIRLLRM